MIKEIAFKDKGIDRRDGRCADCESTLFRLVMFKNDGVKLVCASCENIFKGLLIGLELK